MRRLLLAITALALPVVGILAFAGTAVAASSVSCSKLTGTATSSGSSKDKLSSCTDTANTGASGTFSSSGSSATTGTIKWASGHGTTTFDNVSSSLVSPDACPNSGIEEEVTGTVSKDTGKATSIKVGWTLQVFICATPNSSGSFTLSLAPGTKWEMGAKF
jgi:hypothetical protein